MQEWIQDVSIQEVLGSKEVYESVSYKAKYTISVDEDDYEGKEFLVDLTQAFDLPLYFRKPPLQNNGRMDESPYH